MIAEQILPLPIIIPAMDGLIETHYCEQPEGHEDYAWTAWYRDEEPDEFGGVAYGYGRTQERAIAQLMHRFPREA